MEVAGARAGALRPRARPPSKEEDDRGRGQVGWAGQLGRQAGQVSGPGSFLSLLLFHFLFSVNVFGFNKNARAFPKIMKLLNVTVWNITNNKYFSL